MLSNRTQIVDVVRMITPETFLESLGEKGSMSAFDLLYDRACDAAVRLVSTPAVTGRPSHLREAMIYDYARALVAKRDEFGSRAVRTLQ